MARIRNIEIRNFRSIKSLSWFPHNGINCLIGPGDIGKSSILDAIDFCIGSKRNLQFHDTDFFELNVEEPISISITIGDLEDSLKNFEKYGLFLRGYCSLLGLIEDEPKHNLETVLTINLSVNSDLEPVWSLISERSEGQSRNLSWEDRLQICPTRIGNSSDNNLTWKQGSVLNKISDERANASAALTKAARDARNSFGDSANEKLATALTIAKKTAESLGIRIEGNIKALLEMRFNSFGGSISLHNNKNIPLRNLGDGSSRLLVAGLQKEAANNSSIILIDEVEYGLEPHRIIRLLSSLGSKEEKEPLQVFMTTHSPIVLRELNVTQLYILRKNGDSHIPNFAGKYKEEAQGTIRVHPEAFLASSVIVCEGATEVGFIRGLDHYKSSKNEISIFACGTSLVDAGGITKVFNRASCFSNLGYRTAVLRDDDEKPNEKEEISFGTNGGKVFKWSDNLAIEEEIFNSIDTDSVIKLVMFAIKLHGKELIDSHLKSGSNNAINLDNYKDQLQSKDTEQKIRTLLGKVAKSKNNSWYKTVSDMELAAQYIIAPNLDKADISFQSKVKEIFLWMSYVN